jgi:hypothetical protein
VTLLPAFVQAFPGPVGARGVKQLVGAEDVRLDSSEPPPGVEVDHVQGLGFTFSLRLFSPDAVLLLGNGHPVPWQSSG